MLGGGHIDTPKLPASEQLSFDALARLSEAIRIYELNRTCKLVLSGYSSTGKVSHAEILGKAAVSLGVSPGDTLLLPGGSRTSEEIEAFTSRFGTDRPIILVTSALHMPRAMEWCNRYQFKPRPAPAGYLMKFDPITPRYDFIPTYQKVMLWQRVLHETWGFLTMPKVTK